MQSASAEPASSHLGFTCLLTTWHGHVDQFHPVAAAAWRWMLLLPGRTALHSPFLGDMLEPKRGDLLQKQCVCLQ